MTAFATVPSALKHLKSGGMLIVVDDANRENEGDLVIAAEHVTATDMTFIIRHTGGVACLALSNAIADQLHLPPMVSRNTSLRKTPFTVSIEAAKGITTGISAKDRAKTIRTAIRKHAVPNDLRRPGHVFPLRAQDGGVLVRTGHTEASVDLCHLAGLREGAVISELMHDDGTMMRLPALQKFAKTHQLPILRIEDLIAWRRRQESLIERVSKASIRTQTGNWTVHVYRDRVTGQEHAALTQGNVSRNNPVLTRVHSECLTGDVFHSLQCDCGWQLEESMRVINKTGTGVVLYLRQEGRGIGLGNKIKAYALQARHRLDTVEANRKLGLPVDLREYGIGAQMLRDLGVTSLKLLTNNPKKISGLRGFGLTVAEQIPIKHPSPGKEQKKYLRTKKKKLGHLL